MDVRESAAKTLAMAARSIPLIVGVVLLAGLARALIPPEVICSVFTGSLLVDPFIGAAAGSIAAGNPATSYVIAGELRGLAVSETAVAAFLIAWVTVGVIHLPAEMGILGARFALVRNLIAFFAAVGVAMLITLTLALTGGGG